MKRQLAHQQSSPRTPRLSPRSTSEAAKTSFQRNTSLDKATLIEKYRSPKNAASALGKHTERETFAHREAAPLTNALHNYHPIDVKYTAIAKLKEK